MNKRSLFVVVVILLISFAAVMSGCYSNISTDSTPGQSATSNTSTITVQPGSAATTTLNTSNSNVPALGFNFPASAVSTTTQVTISEADIASLPANVPAIARAATNSANVNLTAFTIATNPPSVTFFNVPITVSGSVVTSATITAGTTLNLAMLRSNAWVDVSTFTVGATGALTQNFASTSLPGILAPGTYLLYKPAPGTSTAVSNLGIALIADDGYGCHDNGTSVGNCLQVINLYDASQNPLATPTIKTLAYSGAGDIDGQALTPDGSQGILVDGGNTVRFFSNVQTGVPIASTTTVDVSAYGSDGDSVAIMPNGDEAVVSGDSSSVLLLVSGIVSGSPVSSATITVPGARDGVVISNDGKVLIARGYSGLTVFSIAPITPVTGPLGGTISSSFTQIANLTTGIVSPSGEDGRNGIAMSPINSSKAVIIGRDPVTSGPAIQLLTSLPNTPTLATSVTVTGATAVYSVTITPDGTKAIVGTNAGIAMFSGVDTGTLSQVGTLFAPTYAGASGSVTLGAVATLGVTLDGKYAVLCDSGLSTGSSTGSLLVVPITATGFSAPVGILNNIAVPSNDQMVLH